MTQFPSPARLAEMVNHASANVTFTRGPKESSGPMWRALLPIPGVVPFSVLVGCDHTSGRHLVSKMYDIAEASVEVSMIEKALLGLANRTAGQVTAAMSLDQELGLGRILTDAESWSAAVDGNQKVYLHDKADDIQLEVQIAAHPRGT